MASKKKDHKGGAGPLRKLFICLDKVWRAIFRPSIHTFFFWSFLIYMISALIITVSKPAAMDFFCKVRPQSIRGGLGCTNCSSKLLMCDKDSCWRNAINVTYIANATDPASSMYQDFQDAATDVSCNSLITSDVNDPMEMIAAIFQGEVLNGLKVTAACKSYHCGVLRNALVRIPDLNSATSVCTNTYGSKPRAEEGVCPCVSQIEKYWHVGELATEDMVPATSIWGTNTSWSIATAIIFDTCGGSPFLSELAIACSWWGQETWPTWCGSTTTTTTTTTTTGTNTSTAPPSTTAAARLLSEEEGESPVEVAEDVSGSVWTAALPAGGDDDHMEERMMNPGGRTAAEMEHIRRALASILTKDESLAQWRTEGQVYAPASDWKEPAPRALAGASAGADADGADDAIDSALVGGTWAASSSMLRAAEAPPRQLQSTAAPTSSGAVANDELQDYEAGDWGRCTCYQQCTRGVRTRLVECLAEKCKAPKPADRESCTCDHCAGCDIDMRLLILMCLFFVQALLALVTFGCYLNSTSQTEDDFIKLKITQKIGGFFYKQIPPLLRILVLVQLFQVIWLNFDVWLGNLLQDYLGNFAKDCFASKDLRTAGVGVSILWVFQVIMGRCTKKHARKPDWLFSPERASRRFPQKQLGKLLRCLGP